MTTARRLTAKSIKVLGLIADGHSYAQIVDGHHDITYHDIFRAAEEALEINESPSDYHSRLAEIKLRHPKAYEPWTQEEDLQLTSLHIQGIGVDELAKRFQRQPSAIRSRISKLEGP